MPRAARQVGDRGAQALASALPTLRLETLDLGFNNVATAGVAALMQVWCHVFVSCVLLVGRQMDGCVLPCFGFLVFLVGGGGGVTKNGERRKQTWDRRSIPMS